MGWTQQAQVGPALTEVFGPPGCQCQAGKPIRASNNSQSHGCPVLMQCMLQMGKGKFTATAPLPVAPTLSQVEQGDRGQEEVMILPAFSYYCTSESPRKKKKKAPMVQVKSINQLLN